MYKTADELQPVIVYFIKHSSCVDTPSSSLTQLCYCHLSLDDLVRYGVWLLNLLCDIKIMVGNESIYVYHIQQTLKVLYLTKNPSVQDEGVQCL